MKVSNGEAAVKGVDNSRDIKANILNKSFKKSAIGFIMIGQHMGELLGWSYLQIRSRR